MSRIGYLIECCALNALLAACRFDLPSSVDGAVLDAAHSTLTQQAYIKASNAGAADDFGYGIALSADGSTLAVGAEFEASAVAGIDGNQADNSMPGAGAVYVFTRSGTTWSQQAYIKASNPGMNDYFGSSMALSANGSILAVGAYREASAAAGIGGNQADDTAPDTGAVYVFTRSGTTWSQQAYIKASNTGAGDNFGFPVMLSADGTTLAVGALREDSAASDVGGDQADNAAPDAGAAYVFTRSGTTWVQQAYIKAFNTGAGDYFGFDIALSSDGSTLAVTALQEDSAATGIGGNQDDDSAPNAGAAYVFTRNDITWSRQAYLKPSNTGAGDNFGHSVALSADGSTLVVGALWEDSAATGVEGRQDDNSAVDAGAVYVFVRNATTWLQQAYLKPSNTDAGDWFGTAVALSGDGSLLAVNADSEDSAATGVGGDQANNSASDAGAVYLFTRSGTAWSQRAYVKASNTGAGDFFGHRPGVVLSSDGSTLAVGSHREDSAAAGIDGDQSDNSASGAGAVYVFR